MRAAAAVGVALVGYGVLYALWLVFRWGGPDLQLAINDAAFIPLGALATAAALVAAMATPADQGRRSWLLLAAALLAYCLGDGLWFFMEVIQGVSVPSPSWADLGYLGFYPLLLLALVALPRERSSSRLKAALDLGIVVVSAGTILWWLELGPIAAQSGSGVAQTLVAVAYPVGDALLIFALAVAMLGRVTGTTRIALVLLGIGVIANIAADITYARLALEDTYQSGTWTDITYMAGWLAMGLGAVAQAHRAGRMHDRVRRVPAMPSAAFLPYAAVFAVDALLAVSAVDIATDARVLVYGAIVVTALAASRLAITARENGRLLAEQASLRSEARFRAIIQNASDIITLVSPAGELYYVSPSVESVLGQDAALLSGGRLTSLLRPEDAPLVLESLRTAASRTGLTGPVTCRSGSGARQLELTASNLLADPLVGALVVTISDVTERRRFEEQLKSQALHDPLTGLANRVLLADRVEQALRRGLRQRGRPAVLYLDIDDFKGINDTLGHVAGDRVLVEIGQRLASCIRGEDTAARIGGDEFAVLIEDSNDTQEAIDVAVRIRDALRRPVELDVASCTVSASIGIVRSDAPRDSTVELLRDADIAMYEAKRESRGSYRVFEPEMYAATVDRVRLETDIRRALDRDEFEVVYQPLMELHGGRLMGVEALLRWHHPNRGLLMPELFIPIAEYTGEIRRIGLWVLARACSTVLEWSRHLGQAPLRASVNVSVRQLEPDFVADVAKVLEQTGFPAALLVLEITESAFASERAQVADILGRLRTLGVRIAIDDFGTGYSALSYVRDLPVDELKIDRAFIREMQERNDSGLVSTILRLGRDLGLQTVAEGIETAEQANALRALGCEVGQGFVLGRPASSASIASGLGIDEPGPLAKAG